MLLKEVFDQLACAELNNISVVDQTTKEIDPGQYRQVVTAINAGLTEIHSRVLLRQGMLTVKLIPGQELYTLDKAYNVSASKPDPKQFITAVPPFANDLLAVHEVKAKVYEPGFEKEVVLGLNNGSDYYNVEMPSYNQLFVPAKLQSEQKITELLVSYRKNHKMLATCDNDIDPECVGLTLPRSYLWALCLFVAARMHTPVGLQDATYSGNSFMAQFAQELAQMQISGLSLSNIQVNEGVWRKGFP
jgi:hypothetical protein